jgi:hypothetical protein
MSFDLPANIERDLERYAQAEQITPAEAVVKFVQSGLKAKRRKAGRSELTEAELDQLRKSPTAQFFGALPTHVVDEMEKASKEIRAERFVPRG